MGPLDVGSAAQVALLSIAAPRSLTPEGWSEALEAAVQIELTAMVAALNALELSYLFSWL